MRPPALCGVGPGGEGGQRSDTGRNAPECYAQVVGPRARHYPVEPWLFAAVGVAVDSGASFQLGREQGKVKLVRRYAEFPVVFQGGSGRYPAPHQGGVDVVAEVDAFPQLGELVIVGAGLSDDGRRGLRLKQLGGGQRFVGVSNLAG